MIIHKKSSFSIFVALMATCTGSMSIFGTSTHGTVAAAAVVVVDDTAAAAAIDASSLLRGHRRLDDEDEEDGTSSCLSIPDTICASGDHEVLCGLFQKYDTIDTALSSSEGGNDWIVFAPNDDAFASSKTMQTLLEDTLDDADVQDVLEFHVASVEANTTTISAASSCGEKLNMFNGDDSRTKCKNGNMYQTGTGNLPGNHDDEDDRSAIGPQIIDPDDPIEACNGIIHVLDGVMLPKLSRSAVLAGSTDEDDVEDDVDEDDEIGSPIMTQNGDYLDPDKCYGIVGTCTNSTSGGTQMNFNRPAQLVGECPPNSVCSGNGNCECNLGYCAVADDKCQYIPKPPATQYTQTVRVRKEWRTLSDNEIERIAKAFSIMNTTDTLTGREKYGKHFWNAQDLVVFHVCAVVDPRCDQAHFGPNFMTFHRAYLLLIENSLRAVDPEILALPYWAMQLDSKNGIYNPRNPDATDKDKYIFTNKYFGRYFTREEDDFVVTDGLFAYWSVPEWVFNETNVYNDPSLAGQLRYGPDSDMGRSSLNTTHPGINKVSTCIALGLYLPAQPGTAQPSENPASVQCTQGSEDSECQKSMFGCGCGATDQVQNDESYRPGYNAVGQGARSIPDYCSDDCLKDSTKCPLYARSDHYSCSAYVQRNPADKIYSNRFASNTNEITFTKEDFNMCTNPRNVNSWMEWQNCIEKRTDGVCEIRVDDEMTKWQWLVSSQTGMAPSVGNFSHFSNEGREKEIQSQFHKVNADVQDSLDVLAGLKPDETALSPNGQGRSEYVGLATVWGCANPMGYVDTANGRIGINNLHAQGHIRIGLDMFDTGTSSTDMGAFHGHHAHVDMSNLMWMQQMGNEGKVRHYGYPTGDQTRKNSREWIATAGLSPYGTSGPFGTYDMTYCQDYSVSYRYNGTRPEVQDIEGPKSYSFLEGGPWLHGTTLGEVITEHFPFFDLYADYDGGDRGYTHKDVIEHSFPDRTDYIYDKMTEYYPNICTDSKDCPPLPGFN
jgi:hypothetical protein